MIQQYVDDSTKISVLANDDGGYYDLQVKALE
jgi:hypothetical protein